jgi:DNA gyrase subunit A
MKKTTKKLSRAEKFKPIVKENIREVSLVETATHNLKVYGSYTLEQRAIPDFRDGLKPVHRMVLWTFNVENFRSDGRHQKAAKVVGTCIGNYHPHSDAGVYSSMVTMANLPEKLIDGRGNWGSPTDSAGAYRYTECRLSKYAENYLLDKDYLAVCDYIDNFSGDKKVPVILPAKLPNLLINGSEGIGTGASGLIPSYTKDSIIILVKKALNGKPCTTSMCLKYLEFNFSNGGICVSSKDDLKEYYDTGKGTILFQPTFKLEPNRIVITSLAPRFIVANSLESRMEVYSKIPNVEKVQDESDKEGWKICIYYKKRLDDKQVKELLSLVKTKSTTKLSLQTAITERNSDETVVFSYSNIPEIINRWVAWRIEFELKVINNLIKVRTKELEKLNLLQLAAKNLDTMKQTMDVKDPITLLRKLKLNKQPLTEDQANYLLDLKFKQLTKLSREKLLKEIEKVKEDISFLEKDLTQPEVRILRGLK